MLLKVEVIVTTVDKENGNLAIRSSSSTEIPDLTEFKKLGFSNSFNTVETAVINTVNKAEKEAIENLFEAVSHKIVTDAQQQLSPEISSEIISVPYPVEAEIGTLVINSKKLVSGNTTIYNTVGTFLEPIGPREKWHSPRLKELELMTVAQMTMRSSTELLNRIRNQDNQSIIPTTLRNRSEKDGFNVLDVISQKSEETLSQADYDNWFIAPPKPKDSFDSSYQMNPSLVEAAAKDLGMSKFNLEDYEEPARTTNISVDEICVKGQNPKRPMSSEIKKRKLIYTSVINIENQNGNYNLIDKSIQSSLRLTTGFLEYNSILNEDQLVFYTDGAREIHDNISNLFAYTKYKIILDWFHLEKKFKEFGSLAFRGKKYRNEFLNIVRPALWRGDVDGAINLLEKVDNSTIKNPTYLVQLATYLNRVRDFIPCYALRKKLGLRNSSNRGEKSNDIVVAKRQKHNGMSWSPDGSLGLAAITCLKANGELKDWTSNQTIPFNLVPVEFKKAA